MPSFWLLNTVQVHPARCSLIAFLFSFFLPSSAFFSAWNSSGAKDPTALLKGCNPLLKLPLLPYVPLLTCADLLCCLIYFSADSVLKSAEVGSVNDRWVS